MKLKTKIAQNERGIFVVLENDGIGAGLLRGEDWEPHFADILSALNLEGTTALDLGANFGANTVSLVKAVGDSGVVIAFEPQRICFQQLCGTVVLNGFANVVCLQKAVGETSGIVQLGEVNYFANSVNIGNAGLGAGGEQVEMVNLDSLGLQKVSFIKMDIQGSETKALIGARNLIAESRPCMFLEIEQDQLKDRGSSAEELIKLVFDMGYNLLHIANNYPVDFVAVPREMPELITKIQAKLKCPSNICVP